MGSIPITRSIPGQPQARCGNSRRLNFLIAWVIPSVLGRRANPVHCPGLPQSAPAFARKFALGVDHGASGVNLMRLE